MYMKPISLRDCFDHGLNRECKIHLAQISFIYGKVQTLDWTTGMEYWTDIFLVFTHVVQ